MQGESCCPKGSWPRLQVNYQSKGQRLDIGNTKCYHVGEGNKVLLLISDIFGATSGKHQAFADTFSTLGYNVYLPQIIGNNYQGQMDTGHIIAYIKSLDFQAMKTRYTTITKYIQEKGNKNFFAIGFCWGVWFTFKMATQFDNIIAIGGMHPSLGLEQVFGGDVNQLTKKVKSPTHLFPAGNDPQNIKPNGQIIKILQQKFGKQKVGSVEFPDMIHGWTVRGDVADQKVKRDVKSAIQLCDKYFAKFQ